MLAVASFMSGLPPSDIMGYFKDAFYRYDMAAGKADQEIRRYATRSQLLLADYCSERRLFAEANAALMRAQSHVCLTPLTDLPNSHSLASCTHLNEDCIQSFQLLS